MHKYPQVLLLGNGINRAYELPSWNKFLSDICTNDKYRSEIDSENKCEECGRSTSMLDGFPEPLKAILLTEDNVSEILKNKKKDKTEKNELFSKINSNFAQTLQELISIGFDEILTTNYSYEIEMALLNKVDEEISEASVKRLMKHTSEVKIAEKKYLLHTYNEVRYNGSVHRIWHIHGEARKPDSMILSHYYYANHLCHLKNACDKRCNYYSVRQKNNQPIKIQGWFDAFIMGDVYVLGFGFELSEFDLWWLLNRKKRENAEHGKVYFYELYEDEPSTAKIDLIKYLGCEVIPIKVSDLCWKKAYAEAINNIKMKIKENEPCQNS